MYHYPTEPETALEKTIIELRENRIKFLTDYMIMHKYGRYHLVCTDCYYNTITKVAEKQGLVFSTKVCISHI